MTKLSLIKRAEKLENEANQLQLTDGGSLETYQTISGLYAEAAKLREWAEYGCLTGQPTSTWRP